MRLTSRVTWFWPVTILVSALGMYFVMFHAADSPIRPLLALWFLFICPGMAFVPLLRIQDGFAEFTLAIALSLALDAGVAMLLLYTGVWFPVWGLVILLWISIGGVLLQLLVGYGTMFIGSRTSVLANIRWNWALATGFLLLVAGMMGLAILRVTPLSTAAIQTGQEQPDGPNQAPSQLNTSPAPIAPSAAPSSINQSQTDIAASPAQANPTAPVVSNVDQNVTPTVSSSEPAAVSAAPTRSTIVGEPAVLATTTSTQTLPTSVPERFVEDTFSSPTSGWPIRQSEQWSAEYVNDRYQLTLTDQTSINVSTSLAVRDYRLSVDVAIVQGSAGVVFLSTDRATFYRLLITADGTYALQILQQDSNTPTNVVDWTASSALQQGVGVTNRVQVERQNTNIRFVANGQLLTEFTVPSGEFTNQYGFALTSPNNQAQATFDNLIGEYP